MRKFFLYSIVLAGLIACGNPLKKLHVKVHPAGATRQFSTTDGVFQPFKLQFDAAARKTHPGSTFTLSNIPINFGNTENKEFDGVCHKYSNGTKEIIIRKAWWISTTEDFKRLMIFHELGHCALERSHKNEKIPFRTIQYNESIMSAVLMNPFYYKSFRDSYDHELFTSSSEKLRAVFGLEAN